MSAAFTFQIQTFGCKVNQYESEAIREFWLELGAKECPLERAQLVLLSTCAVTNQAVSDSRQAARKILRQNSRARLVVSGCAATALPKQFALPGVFQIIPQPAKAALLCDNPLDEPPSLAEQDLHNWQLTFPGFRLSGNQRARPVLKVQDGCSHGCTYCIVPSCRGPARSRDLAEVIAEAERLLAAGYHELVLSGINLRQYRNQGHDFWDLLRLLDAELSKNWLGRARLRVSSLDPAQLDQRAIDCLAGCNLVCPHLHLSLQSGSPTVLARMNRAHYDPRQLVSRLQEVRQIWPKFGLGADFLLGFPGESEEEFAQTLALIEALPFSYAHVFPYSERPGTRAAELPQLPMAVRRARAAQVRKLVERKKAAFLHDLLQIKSIDLILNDDGSQTGINQYYAPCALEQGSGTLNQSLLAVRPLRVEQGRIICGMI